MKAAALIAFMLAGAYYFASAAVPVLENKCRLPVHVYCGQGRVGHKAEVTKDGERITEIRCADDKR